MNLFNYDILRQEVFYMTFTENYLDDIPMNTEFILNSMNKGLED